MTLSLNLIKFNVRGYTDFKGQKSIFSVIFFLNILNELFYSNFWHIKNNMSTKFHEIFIKKY